MERARLLTGLATRSSIVLPAVCSCRFVAVARARLLTRGSMAVCQQCVQPVSACFFGSVAQLMCKLLCSTDAAHYQAACTLFYCSASGVYTRLYDAFLATQRRAKPDTKRPPPRARPRVRAAFKSSFLRWKGDFTGPATACQNSRPRTILSRFFTRYRNSVQQELRYALHK